MSVPRHFGIPVQSLASVSEEDLEAARCDWLWLLDATFSYVSEIAPGEVWHTTQVKEKFAGLRIYLSGYPGAEGDDVIEAAELISHYVCDVCGGLGKVRKSGWWRTTCDAHAHVAEI